MGQDTVWAGTFWGALNVLLRASGTQLGLDQTCFVIVIRHQSSVRLDRRALPYSFQSRAEQAQGEMPYQHDIGIGMRTKRDR